MASSSQCHRHSTLGCDGEAGRDVFFAGRPHHGLRKLPNDPSEVLAMAGKCPRREKDLSPDVPAKVGLNHLPFQLWVQVYRIELGARARTGEAFVS